MGLDELVRLVEALRTRMEKHRPLLQQSEALTRYVLIDPALRALGWDTENPDLVRPEYTAGQGAADYALLQSDKPIAFVEAKALGKPLSQGLNQSINYCIQTGTPHFIVTDGQQWEIYETHKPVPLDQKRIAAFDLGKSDLKEAVLSLLHLWKPGAAPGYPIAPSSPVTTTPPRGPSTTPSNQPPPQPTEAWIPLASFRAQSGQRPPSALRFPDGTTRPISYWKDILVLTVEWLVGQGLLAPVQCPLKHPNASTRYVVNSTPTHPGGRAFSDPKQVGSLYVETNVNAYLAVGEGQFLIRKLGQDPARFMLNTEASHS